MYASRAFGMRQDVVKVLLPTKVGGRIYEYLNPPLK